ncbi:MAG: DUF5696 domain-containing protein [Bacillota bacterium]
MNKYYPGIIFLVLLLFITTAAGISAEIPENYELKAQNRYLGLYINEEDTTVALQRKDNKDVWFTNPDDWEEKEEIAGGSTKNRLGANLFLSYFTPRDQERNFDSYNDSIAYDQFEIETVDKGIRVVYTLGEEWNDDDYMPLIVAKESFTSGVLDELEESERDELVDQYALLTVEEVEDSDEENEDLLAGKYRLQTADGDDPSTTNYNMFIDHLLNQKDNLEDEDEIAEDDIEPFVGEEFYILNKRKGDILEWVKGDLIKYIQKAGFTPEDVQKNYVQFGLKPDEPNVRVFRIPLEYRLDGEDLLVRVPVSEIEYPSNVFDDLGQKVSYPPYRLSVLPFFGAAHLDEDGYLLLPDGSGTLINFNNGKTSSPAYHSRIYGRDYAVDLQETRNRMDQQAYLPVFGINRQNKGLFSIIEEGDSLAGVRADIAESRYSFNYAYPEFTIMPYALTNLQGDVTEYTQNVPGGSAQWVHGIETANIYPPEMYQGDIKIRYKFLSEDKSDYSSMAKEYRDYLKEKHNLERLTAQKSAPLYLDIVGAVTRVEPVYGISQRVVNPLTSYSEAEEIMEYFTSRGIENMNVKFSGWSQEGLEHNFPKNLELEDELGSKRDFNNLVSYAQSNGINLYPDIHLLNVHHDKLFDSFSPRSYGANFLDRTFAQVPALNAFDLALGGLEVGRTDYILAPHRLSDVIADFMDTYEQFSVQNLSLRSFGSQLTADYSQNVEELIYREEAKEIVTENLASLTDEHDLSIMSRGSNEYILPYVKDLLDLPLGDSSFDLADESVPFLQMVLHGYINYSFKPINYRENLRDYVLKYIETGAYPQVQLIKEPATELKGTRFDYLYPTNFDSWKEETLEIYEEVNSVLGDLQDLEIVEHQKLADKVYQTTFEEDQKIIVNYNQNSVEIDDYEIAGKNYMILGDE